MQAAPGLPCAIAMKKAVANAVTAVIVNQNVDVEQKHQGSIGVI
jgi:hypothetical protein